MMWRHWCQTHFLQVTCVSSLSCVSCVPASCVLIWFVSCPHLMWLLVNSCPGVFMWLSMSYLCIYSPVCSVWFRPGLLVTPGVSALSCPDVYIKYYYLSLRPRLRVLVPPCCVHRDNMIDNDVEILKMRQQ